MRLPKLITFLSMCSANVFPWSLKHQRSKLGTHLQYTAFMKHEDKAFYFNSLYFSGFSWMFPSTNLTSPRIFSYTGKGCRQKVNMSFQILLISQKAESTLSVSPIYPSSSHHKRWKMGTHRKVEQTMFSKTKLNFFLFH